MYLSLAVKGHAGLSGPMVTGPMVTGPIVMGLIKNLTEVQSAYGIDP